MKNKVVREYYDSEYQCVVQVYESQKNKKSNWMKDFAYSRIKQIVPDNNNTLFTNFTRKNQA